MIETSHQELLRRVLQSHGREVHTTLPGEIVTYDPSKQRASVKVTLKISGETESDFENLPTLEDVPVQHLGGNRLYIHVPLTQGDPCVLHFFENDVSEYYENGDPLPATSARHGLTCYATPGVLTIAKAIAGAGNAAIELAGNDDYVALANKTDAQFQKIVDLFTNWTPVAQDGGAALKAASASLVFDSVKTEKVKIGS